jgi:NAD+ synthase (glutamine-hydrolysing)
MFRIALAQINPTVGDLQGNQEKIRDYIGQAQKIQADAVVFPELALCGYPPEDLLFKEHFLHDQLKALQRIVHETQETAVVVGFVDQDKKGNLYNAAAVIHRGKIKGVYRKEALPNYGVFDEKRYFHAGENNPMFLIAGVPVGLSICEDIWINPGPCSAQIKKGAKILINLSSSPYDTDKLKARQVLLKNTARKSKAFVCYNNLIGGQDELVFDGGSMVYHPSGEIIASGKQFEEDLIAADLLIPAVTKTPKRNFTVVSKNLDAIKTRLNPCNASQFNRIERIYKALVLGTRDYIRKNGFKKILIGLSGGIDSALVAAIASDAIGRENVIGVSMPSRYSSEATKSDAKELAQRLKIQFKEILIEDIFKVYLDQLQPEFAGTAVSIAEENIQARIRGNILMALSNKFGWLVLTTGNKSEFAVGYCTLYGDMSGGFAVIKDVPKTVVYELSRYRNSLGQEVIPQSIIDRPPTAELRLNQKDQDSLPPYDVLDEILAGYVENHQSIKSLSRKSDGETVKRVIRLIDTNEYKRRQAPPGVKITARAFGKDWRLPITNKYKEF